jgi:hypothetical protein
MYCFFSFTIKLCVCVCERERVREKPNYFTYQVTSCYDSVHLLISYVLAWTHWWRRCQFHKNQTLSSCSSSKCNEWWETALVKLWKTIMCV